MWPAQPTVWDCGLARAGADPGHFIRGPGRRLLGYFGRRRDTRAPCDRRRLGPDDPAWRGCDGLVRTVRNPPFDSWSHGSPFNRGAACDRHVTFRRFLTLLFGRLAASSADDRKVARRRLRCALSESTVRCEKRARLEPTTVILDNGVIGMTRPITPLAPSSGCRSTEDSNGQVNWNSDGETRRRRWASKRPGQQGRRSR